ncbi:MAG TPA: EAL domain-containing protein [Longimicrobiales bacterium]|nr:EAL domain-containing protein [Longimicrobiales bacterium]
MPHNIGNVVNTASQPEQPGEQHIASFLLAEGGADRAILLVSVEGKIIEALGGSTDILGGQPGDLRGMAFASLIASVGAGNQSNPRVIEQALHGRFLRRRCWCVRKDRTRFWAEVIAAPVRATNNNVIGCAVAIRDLSELRTAEQAAKVRTKVRTEGDPQSTAASMLDGITNALFAVDEEWHFVYLNSRSAQMLRKPREQLIGASIWEELPVGDGSAFQRNLQKCASERMAVQFEEYYPLLNSWYEVHAYPFSGGVVVYFWDISDRKLEIQRVKQQSLHDPLTGVANTLLFQDRLNNALARSGRNAGQLAVLLVDLDGLGRVNSRHGHTVGDLLLQTVGSRLGLVVRRSDTIARLGGDEFAVLTTDHLQADGPAMLAEKLLSAAARVFDLTEAEIEITASIGIAIYPQDGTDADSLTKAADAALSAAKTQGGNSYRFFSADLTHEVKRRRAMEHELRAAISDSDFELWYMPEHSIVAGEVTAMEALLRWNRPDGLRVRPSEFMPSMYSTDVVSQMDRWVLKQACLDRAAWLEAGAPRVPVTVNISTATLLFGDLVTMVRQALDMSGLDPAFLELEFSQSSLLKIDTAVFKTFGDLRALGVALSLDDVGHSGWATVAALEAYPFGKIKIDPTLFGSGETGIDHEAAIRAASTFAHAMNRRVVAERIESAKQLEFMRTCGCDAAQGEFVAAAVEPGSALSAWKVTAA